MSFALPEAMREYIRDLIRKDQEEQSRLRLRALLEEGLASGPPQPRRKADVDALRALARGTRR